MNEPFTGFWLRLKTFIENVEVHDLPGQEEKQMILKVCEDNMKPDNTSENVDHILMGYKKVKFSMLEVGDMFECWGDVHINYNYPKWCLCQKISDTLAQELGGASFSMNEADEVSQKPAYARRRNTP